MVNIEGLDKADVLIALYNRAQIQGLGFLDKKERPLTKPEAKELLKRKTYFDYLYGRVMKVDLSKDEFDPWLYDHHNGQGAAEKVINQLRYPHIIS